MEVSAAAANAEDAGLLQYSKTLDSLETKLNNLSTSFQQFYMSLANGETFGGAIEGITKFIEGLNKLGNFSAIANIAGILSSLKLVGKTAVTTFTTMTSQIKSNVETVFTQIAASMVSKMRAAGRDSSLAVQQGAIEGQQQTKNGVPVVGFNMNTQKGVRWAKGINIAAMAGAGLSLVGTSVAADNAVAGSLMTAAGSVSSYGSQGAMIGAALGHPVIGAIAGGIVGLFSQLPAFVNALANQAQEELDKATKKAEEKNLERAQAAEDYRSLESTIENLKKLQAARYDSEEAAKAFVDAQKDAAEKFPELISGYTATGDAIVEVIGGTVDAEALLADARKQSAQATVDAAKAELERANKQANVDEEAYNKYTEAEEKFYSDFNVPEGSKLSDYTSFKNYILQTQQNVPEGLVDKDESAFISAYTSQWMALLDTLGSTIKDTSEIDKIIENADRLSDNDYFDKLYNAIVSQFYLEKKQAGGQLSSTQELQASDQRTVVSSLFTKYLADNQITGDWLQNNTVNSLVGQAFRNRIFDEQGNIRENIDILDENNQIVDSKVKEIAQKFYNEYSAFLSSLTGSSLENFVQIIEGVDKGQYNQSQLEEELGIFNLDASTEIYKTLLAPINKVLKENNYGG